MVAQTSDRTYASGACGLRSNQTEARFEGLEIIDSRVFVVHGHDEGARESVARLLERQGLEPVILQDEPNIGRLLIDKFEQTAADVGFAIVLLTPDDEGSSAKSPGQPRSRARQNAIFELGYFVARMGRDRVCALVKGEIELPSDYGGVVNIPMDEHGGWRLRVVNELRAAKFDVHLIACNRTPSDRLNTVAG